MKTPWKSVTTLEPGAEYVAVVTDLEPRSIRSTARMFGGARRASTQMEEAAGVIGFATQAQPLRKRYRTISLWRSGADVDAFARSGDHGNLMRQLTPELRTARSRRWTVPGDAGRPTWKDAARQLGRS